MCVVKKLFLKELCERKSHIHIRANVVDTLNVQVLNININETASYTSCQLYVFSLFIIKFIRKQFPVSAPRPLCAWTSAMVTEFKRNRDF